jgi:glycine/D-amino acid oxidase-like deaminating enzyme
MMEADAIVIGGGIVGAAMAYGLARRGLKVAMLDQDDDAFRASRANFALVWVQSKGLGRPEYAAWSRRSAGLWPELAAELKETTGIETGYRQPGGVAPALSEDELAQKVANLEQIKREAGNQPFQFEVLDRPALDRLLPGLGPKVVGGTYCPLDGDTNSLRSLRALHEGVTRQGGSYHPGRTVTAIEALAGGGARVLTEAGEAFEAPRVVIAAGLGNKALGAMAGLEVPVRPVQGQVIVTEKVAPLFDLPTINVRQTDEGGIMLGASEAEVGFDTSTEPAILGRIARRNVDTFPFLAKLNVVRTWAGLRVMTPDGFPIYQQSRTHPGVFVVTGHSGVTTAAAHALELAGWVAEGAIPAHMAALGTERFHAAPAG